MAACGGHSQFPKRDSTVRGRRIHQSSVSSTAFHSVQGDTAAASQRDPLYNHLLLSTPPSHGRLLGLHAAASTEKTVYCDSLIKYSWWIPNILNICNLIFHSDEVSIARAAHFSASIIISHTQHPLPASSTTMPGKSSICAHRCCSIFQYHSSSTSSFLVPSLFRHQSPLV